MSFGTKGHVMHEVKLVSDKTTVTVNLVTQKQTFRLQTVQPQKI